MITAPGRLSRALALAGALLAVAAACGRYGPPRRIESPPVHVAPGAEAEAATEVDDATASDDEVWRADDATPEADDARARASGPARETAW